MGEEKAWDAGPQGSPSLWNLRFPVCITRQLASPYLRALLKGTAVLLWRASPGLGIPPFSSFPEFQAFWERGTEFFLGKSHLPGEKGSLWVGDGPTPQHRADKPQPPGSCRAAKLPYLSWYFESGGSHARPSKGWLCASVLGREVGGRGEPERLRSRFQGLGLRRGEAWPPGGPPRLNIQGALGVSPRLGVSGSRVPATVSSLVTLVQTSAVASGAASASPPAPVPSKAQPGHDPHLFRPQ